MARLRSMPLDPVMIPPLPPRPTSSRTPTLMLLPPPPPPARIQTRDKPAAAPRPRHHKMAIAPATSPTSSLHGRRVPSLAASWVSCWAKSRAAVRRRRHILPHLVLPLPPHVTTAPRCPGQATVPRHQVIMEVTCRLLNMVPAMVVMGVRPSRGTATPLGPVTAATPCTNPGRTPDTSSPSVGEAAAAAWVLRVA